MAITNLSTTCRWTGARADCRDSLDKAGTNHDAVQCFQSAGVNFTSLIWARAYLVDVVRTFIAECIITPYVLSEVQRDVRLGAATQYKCHATSCRTVNLAPADLPKDSGRFDLPIALGILAASGQIDGSALAGHEFAGELSLSGELRPVRGALAMALALRGLTTALVLPPGSAEEAALVPDSVIYKATHLLDVVQQFLPGRQPDSPPAAGWARQTPHPPQAETSGPDLADVKGQAGPRRALEIAAAGGHSLLFTGPPGAGKSMLAERLAGLLPPMNTDEALESAALASLAGRFTLQHWGRRPTCSPHHTASAVALVGGGSPPRPGEVSLAHHGVLYLDELAG